MNRVEEMGEWFDTSRSTKQRSYRPITSSCITNLERAMAKGTGHLCLRDVIGEDEEMFKTVCELAK